MGHLALGMVAKHKGETKEAAAYKIDWKEQPRRPFKRGFLPYGSEEEPEELTKRRRAYGIEVIEDPAGEDATPAPLDSFEETGTLPHWLLNALRDDDRIEPTPVQAQGLPIALAGQNMVAVVPVAEGHALAHLLPAIVHAEDQPALTEEDPGPVVLVLSPTQELAGKVAEEATSLLRHSEQSLRHTDGMRAVSVSGGGTRSEKLKELTTKGCHVMVGTPKRVHDMAVKEQISLLRVTMLILDGADKMLSLGFEAEIKELASWIRPERHTLILATTWPKDLHDLASRDLCYAGGLPVRFNAPLKAPAPIKATAAKSMAKPASAKSGGAKAPPKAAVKSAAKAAAKTGAKPAAKPVSKANVAAEATAAPDLGDEEFPDDW